MTGKATIRIDDDQIKTRVRRFLAQAWAAGHKDCICACHEFSDQACRHCENPYQ